MTLKEIIEKMKNRLIEIQQKDIKDTYFEIQQILIDLEKANELQKKIIGLLTLKITSECTFCKKNNERKDCIIDKCFNINIISELEKLLNKSWEEIIKE